MPSNLSGKTAIITGASRGIGAAIAIRLAEHGANVVINYNSSSKAAEEVAEKCRSVGVKAIVVQADVSQPSEVEKMFKMAKEKFGRIDIVMSNAGIEYWGAPNVVKSEDIDKVFAINVKGQFLVAQQAYIHMENKGRIILMSSVSAHMGFVEHSVYSASKAAAEGMARSLACDFGPREITVNCIAPGGVKTDMYLLSAAKHIPDGENMIMEQVDAKVAQLTIEGCDLLSEKLRHIRVKRKLSTRN